MSRVNMMIMMSMLAAAQVPSANAIESDAVQRGGQDRRPALVIGSVAQDAPIAHSGQDRNVGKRYVYQETKRIVASSGQDRNVNPSSVPGVELAVWE